MEVVESVTGYLVGDSSKTILEYNNKIMFDGNASFVMCSFSFANYSVSFAESLRIVCGKFAKSLRKIPHANCDCKEFKKCKIGRFTGSGAKLIIPYHSK